MRKPIILQIMLGGYEEEECPKCGMPEDECECEDCGCEDEEDYEEED